MHGLTPEGLANIILLAHLSSICRVVYDSSEEEKFIAHLPDGREWHFVKSENGLYYYDTSSDGNFSKEAVINYCFINTVEDNERKYHRREVDKAKKARTLYTLLNRPSRRSFERYVATNQIINCPITVEDVKRFFHIYGPDVATLRGKTVKKSGSSSPSHVPSRLPQDMLSHHRDVTLCGDLFFVQGMPFLHTISRKIHFRTATPLPNRYKSSILDHLQPIIQLYNSRGFNVTELKADGEFKCLQDDILPVSFDPVAADDHVSDVERSIRTVKDDLRTLTQSLPFKRIPRVMVKAMVSFVLRCRNMFPSTDGVSEHMSPLSIVTGASKPDAAKLTLEFGTYVHIFNDNNPTNTMASRTTGAIALHSVGNTKGD